MRLKNGMGKLSRKARYAKGRGLTNREAKNNSKKKRRVLELLAIQEILRRF